VIQQGSRVVIAPVSRLRRLVFLLEPDARWVYLGKNIEKRIRVETLLGSVRKFPLGGRLHGATGSLRQPFLDFVGEVGARQRDSITWWSTAFSWKSSDLFLLVCYLGLTQDLIREAGEGKRQLIILVEDAWLFNQMKGIWKGDDKVRIEGGVSLWPQKARGLTSCLIKRAWWLVRVMRHYVSQRWEWGARSIDSPRRPAAAIYSYPLTRCLRNDGGWQDPFLPKVDHLLATLGYEVRRFSPPEARGLEQKIAERHQYFYPLILYASASGVVRSLFAFWWAQWPEELKIGGHPVGYLVDREWWMEMGRSSLCVYRMFYECLRSMLRTGEWRLIVYPYENQPWEKMLCLCARGRKIRTVGIQHAIFSSYSMAYFLGASEAGTMPLPDIICASGPYPERLLVEGGTPRNRLRLAGSVRYGHLTGNGTERPSLEHKPAPMTEILVALPIDIHMVRHLLAAIRDAFPSGGVEEGLRFHIKTHPMCPLRDKDIGFPVVRAPDDFRQAVEMCGLVIFAGSTTGPEAIAMGRKVLRYRPEMLLNVDPSEAYSDSIPTCSEENMRDSVLTLIHDSTRQESGEIAEATSRKLFAPLEPKVLLEIFQPL